MPGGRNKDEVGCKKEGNFADDMYVYYFDHTDDFMVVNIIRTYQVIYLKWVQCIICHLCLNKRIRTSISFEQVTLLVKICVKWNTALVEIVKN